MMKDKIEEKNQPKKLKTKQIAIRKKKGTRMDTKN